MSLRTFKFDVEGGKATAGPPIGPALTPLGLNVLSVVERINELTKEFRGMRVPVKVVVDVETKSFEVEVGVPTVAALIAREAGIEKGSGQSGSQVAGNITFEQVVRIARLKTPHLRVKSLKAAVKTVLGTCVSMGVTVDGKDPRAVQEEVDGGAYDHLLSEVTQSP